jgi:aldehyde dehydrogenase (NAD+)
MSSTDVWTPPLQYPDRLFIGGQWVEPSSTARFEVTDSASETHYLSVPEAQSADMDRAVAAARHAFDEGPWPRMTHAERASYLRGIAEGIQARAVDLAQVWPHEAGVLYSVAKSSPNGAKATFNSYAGLADTFVFEEQVEVPGVKFGLLVREPVGVVGAIIPWNAPLGMIARKTAPALLAGCTVVVKLSPEAPAEGYLMAEIVEAAGLPPGVFNVVTADREVSEQLVRNAGVDKITFTGSTLAGRRIASICGERIARVTLELGGKSAAVILDDADIATAAGTIARAECSLNGQVCSSLTRVIVLRSRHDEIVEALAASFAQVNVGDPFDPSVQMGPLVAERQRDRVESYIAKGIAEGATLVAGGGRPKHLERGWYIEPTLFSNVDNDSTIGRDEIFGPVLSVIKADSEDDAVRIANESIYGLNSSVFTNDAERARQVASRLRTGTVGQNAHRSAFNVAFGGFKQSGIGREGGTEGLLPFLEIKVVALDGPPDSYRSRSENGDRQ